MKRVNRIIILVWIALLYPIYGYAQQFSGYYINAGYITNLKKNDDCVKADAGGSVRIGFLNKKKLGFYAGYLWFKEFHKDFIEYDDKGNLFVAGVDILIFKSQNFRGYAQVGIGNEKFISTYPNRTETESNFKPDLGLLLNINHLNVIMGWQPSEPAHFNIGIGLTLFSKQVSD